MGGWTLREIENLDADDYRVLVEWINESTSSDPGEGSIDMDAVVAAKKAKEARG